ncbi:MAG TPA: ATP-binding protein [Lacisediminihabitans sp.]|jgi:signal transduction histidine kinase|nr:ATP-binding protein [Lacisediminihabitans sp.]HXD62495.1 ATP-binding protein [Lacisediminihabitans sp.]
MKIAALYKRLGFDAPSPLLKQAPTTLLVLVAAVAAMTIPGLLVTSPVAVAIAVIAVGAATVFAAIISPRESLWDWGLCVPAVDFFAIGLLRYGTGNNNTVFAALIALPIVWFAAEEGRKFVIYSAIGAAITVFLPFALGLTIADNLDLFLRAGFTVIVYTFAAAVINEISHTARHRLDKVRKLAEQSRVMLAESVQHAIELKQSEAKVRTAERMFREIWVAVTEQAIIGTDLTGLVDAFNPGAEKMLGVPFGEVQGKLHIDEFHVEEELLERARDLSYPAGATVLNPGFSALVESARLGVAEVREWSYVRADGTTIPIELSVTPRLDKTGEIVGYLFVAYDQTKAREVARLKDEFVGLISHELRTPLSSILGYLELMRDDDETQLSDSQLRYLGVAERNAHRLLRLVGDLLFTAQVESGKFNLDQKEQDLAPILLASVESARPVAAAAGITLHTNVVEGLLVNGDSVRLGQACDNLMSNAIKFTPSGGSVTLGLQPDGDNVVITVQDTGMGIAASELDKLFSRFFRASTATRNAVPGVGLGLVITRAIIRAHGGDMGVTSEEGVGTCFSMTLPVVQPANVLAGA